MKRETELVPQPTYGSAGLHTLLGKPPPKSPMLHHGPAFDSLGRAKSSATLQPRPQTSEPRLRRSATPTRRRLNDGLAAKSAKSMRAWKPKGLAVPRVTAVRPAVWAVQLVRGALTPAMCQTTLIGDSELAIQFTLASPLEPAKMLGSVYGAWCKDLGKGMTAASAGTGVGAAAGLSPVTIGLAATPMSSSASLVSKATAGSPLSGFGGSSRSIPVLSSPPRLTAGTKMSFGARPVPLAASASQPELGSGARNKRGRRKARDAGSPTLESVAEHDSSLSLVPPDTPGSPSSGHAAAGRVSTALLHPLPPCSKCALC